MRVWEDATKGSEVELPKVWYLPGDTPPTTLYVEGYQTSGSVRDCADLLVGAGRAAGLTSTGYTNAANLATNNQYTNARISFKVLRDQNDDFINLDTQDEVTIHLGSGDAPVAYLGDLIIIDFGNDGTWDHATAIHEDNGTNSGVLDLDDDLVCMGHTGVTVPSLRGLVDKGDSFTIRYF